MVTKRMPSKKNDTFAFRHATTTIESMDLMRIQTSSTSACRGVVFCGKCGLWKYSGYLTGTSMFRTASSRRARRDEKLVVLAAPSKLLPGARHFIALGGAPSSFTFSLSLLATSVRQKVKHTRDDCCSGTSRNCNSLRKHGNK